jgi:DNA mismatch repair protein MutS
MAGMPGSVLQRATNILSQLEKKHVTDDQENGNNEAPFSKKGEEIQLSFFQLDDPLLERIRDDIMGLDINTLTPVEALMKLNEIKNLLKKY